MRKVDLESLRLRPIVLDDAPAYEKAMTPYAVSMMTSSKPHPVEPGYALKRIKRMIENTDLDIYAAVGLVDGEEIFLGVGGLHPNPENEEGILEFGYLVDQDFHGQGVGTKVAFALKAKAKSAGACYLCADVFHDNPASIAVMNKIGMKKIGERMDVSAARGCEALCFDFRVCL